jgi:alpha-tubulin suppressor-like RCC1 family protein
MSDQTKSFAIIALLALSVGALACSGGGATPDAGAGVGGMAATGGAGGVTTTLPDGGLPGGTHPIAVATGHAFTCALLGNGSIACWGTNTWGQLGAGVTVDGTKTFSVRPVASKELVHGPYTQVACGDTHACALLSTGTAECWGQNIKGQLGDGTTTNSLAPVAVAGLTQIKSLALGSSASCAVLADSSVWCWGLNMGAAAGAPKTFPAPVAVAGLTAVKTVAIGSSHACAVNLDGSVACWGQGAFGTLGRDLASSPVPVAVPGIAGATGVALGNEHTCAVLADGTVWCWGNNSSGQLGNGDLNGTVSVYNPSLVVGVAGATVIAAGDDHSCALLSDLTVKCWGQDANGDLGDGRPNGKSLAVPVAGLQGAMSISASLGTTCVMVGTALVECWGYNFDGQVGDGTTTNSLVPIVVGL